MKKRNIVVVFGTRPEAIKMAPVIKRFQKNPDSVSVTVCVTAQHREMLDQALGVFSIKPDIDLDVMTPGQTLAGVTSKILDGVTKVIAQEKPDAVLVHGDTTTTMATAMASFYCDVPVGHVEAGLRTNNLLSPFPEELNRQITTKLSTWNFVPTEYNRQTLLNEKVDPRTITVTGNTVVDALFWMLQEIDRNPLKRERIYNSLSKQLLFDWPNERFVLITGHRRENFGVGLSQICDAIGQLAISNPGVKFVYPVHLNPHVLTPVHAALSEFENVVLIEPLEYEAFVYLLKHCAIVLSDSGGIQEEAPSLGKPVLVMRDVTERQEALDAGAVRLVGTDPTAIVSGINDLLNNEESYRTMADAKNPYGDGTASDKIYEVMKEQ